MANPTVEKLKEAGLLYGDKAAVALTSLLFVVCLGAALSKKSIELNPEQVNKSAEAADTNISRRQERDDIIKVLENGGIKPTNFSKEVQDTAKSVLVADNYKPEREWVTPEPGAGLIRDTPVLIAPTDLYAYPGRGGALLFALDEQGNRIPDTEKKDVPKDEPRRGRARRRAGGAMGSGMGGMGGMAGGRGSRKASRKASRKSQADLEKEQQQDVEQKKKEMAAKLAGTDEPSSTKDDQAKKDKQGPGNPPQQQFKEVTKGLRWVAITGFLDHGKMLSNWRTALKNPAVANPHYARLDLERQSRQKDGSWSPWEKVDAEENLKVLDNLPEEDEELTPATVRPDNLNDPLPFLKAGLWEKVHLASLVPKEKKEIAAPPPPMSGMGGMAGMMGSSMSRGMMGGSMGRGMMGGSMGRGMMGGSMGSEMSGMMSRGMGGMSMMGGTPAGGDAGTFWKSEEKRVMVRALDFTPVPDNSYRYHVRIVVFNPNHKRDDVSPGVDTKATELFGPWSEPTDEVNMPADVSAFAMGTLPAAKSDIKVNFQVIRFDHNDGVTIPRKFAASPGEVIGEVSSADIPTSEGTGKKIKPVDFNTHQIVLDAAGGQQPLPSGLAGGALDRPALTLLLRPDGSVLARSQAEDINNEVRKDIERNYAREIKDSNKKRESSMGSGYGSMMGGYGGGMMGEMGGGMMGGGRR
jgi:hypothetical protein